MGINIVHKVTEAFGGALISTFAAENDSELESATEQTSWTSAATGYPISEGQGRRMSRCT